MHIHTFPAKNGDCLLIRCFDGSKSVNILIDGGVPRTYPLVLKKKLADIIKLGEVIDLLVVSHYDDDHIGGIIQLFADGQMHSAVKKVLFNSGSALSKHFFGSEDDSKCIPVPGIDSQEMSETQARTLEKLLRKLRCWDGYLSFSLNTFNIASIEFTILSPEISGLETLSMSWQGEHDELTEMKSAATDYSQTIQDLYRNTFKEDTSKVNLSSIAVLIKHDNISGLLLADAHPSVVCRSLKALGYSKSNRLHVNFVKVSHHGSKANTSDELLNLITCNKFIISTDGSHNGHPHKECLARIIFNHPGCTLYFNYQNEITTTIFLEDDLIMEFNIQYLDSQDFKLCL